MYTLRSYNELYISNVRKVLCICIWKLSAYEAECVYLTVEVSGKPLILEFMKQSRPIIGQEKNYCEAFSCLVINKPFLGRQTLFSDAASLYDYFLQRSLITHITSLMVHISSLKLSNRRVFGKQSSRNDYFERSL